MADLRSKINEIYSLEQLASGDSCVHRLHPLVKILGTLTYIICIVSFGRYELARLVPYIFYPVILISLAEIPWRMIAGRTAVALPFCLFAGVSNLFFDRTPMIWMGAVSISFGMISLLTILFRTVLCVAAVLILVGITPFIQLTGQLVRMHIPGIFISLFEMIYRYLGALLEETSSMYTAYRLRSRTPKGLEMKHMGSFVGQLLLRSFDRAERVYQAMKCRGYALRDPRRERQSLKTDDWCFLLLAGGSSVLFRFMDIIHIMGGRF